MSEENNEIETITEEVVEVEKIEQLKTLIYCGASLPNGVLQQYSVFKNGLPEHLQEQFKACPSIKELFVPIAELVSTRQKIEIQGTRENTLFKKILEYVRG